MKTDTLLLLGAAGAAVLLLSKQGTPEPMPGGGDGGGGSWLEGIGLKTDDGAGQYRFDYSTNEWSSSTSSSPLATPDVTAAAGSGPNLFYSALVDAGASKKSAETATERAWAKTWQPSKVVSVNTTPSGGIVTELVGGSGKTGYEVIGAGGAGASTVSPARALWDVERSEKGDYSLGTKKELKAATAKDIFGSSNQVAGYKI
jgi:hypothetical protein